MADRKTHRPSRHSPGGFIRKTSNDPSSELMEHSNLPRTQHSHIPSDRSCSPRNRKYLNDRARSSSPTSQHFTFGVSSQGSSRSPRSYSDTYQARSISRFKMPDEKPHPSFTTSNWRASTSRSDDGDPASTHEQHLNPFSIATSPPMPPHQNPSRDNGADERYGARDWNREAFETNRNTYTGPDERPSGRFRKNSQLPKNFSRPLTCYYWAQGKCAKHESDCWYAHWNTGVIADAPITVDRRSIAGRAAQSHLDAMDNHRDIARRELDLHNNTRNFRRDLNDLKVRERVITYRERDIYRREAEMEDRLHNLIRQQEHTQAEMDIAYTRAKNDMDQQFKNMVATFSENNDGVIQELVSVKDSFQDVLAKVSDFYECVGKYFLPLEGGVVLQKHTVEDLRAMAAQASECMNTAEAALTKALAKIKEAKGQTTHMPTADVLGSPSELDLNM